MMQEHILINDIVLIIKVNDVDLPNRKKANETEDKAEEVNIW